MKKYRVVELVGGGFGVQVKAHFFSRWRLLQLEPILFSNGALMHIAALRQADKEEIEAKKRLKVKRVCCYD